MILLHRVTKLVDVLGPILLSALSLWICFLLIQPIALVLDPSFTLLANRSIGKIAFTLIVLIHILLLAAAKPRHWWQQFMQTNVYFLGTTTWIKPFLSLFFLFFTSHALLLLALTTTPYATCTLPSLSLVLHKLPNLLFGFIATFFLALTEEAIFRGTLIPLFSHNLSRFGTILLSALIFMLAHNLTAPWELITTDWALGLGLFLLGTILAQIYTITNTLYIGMGAHAGLVFVKVFLRRIPCITYQEPLPWWLHVDLRQSPLVQLLFFALICLIVLIYRTQFKKT